MKKIWRALLTFVLVLPLAFSFVACKNDEADEEETRTLVRNNPPAQTSSLVEVPYDIKSIVRAGANGYLLALIDEKNNPDFYKTVIYGGVYETGSVPQGFANWKDVEADYFSYFERSTGNSTYFNSEHFPLVIPYTDFTAIENDEDRVGYLDTMKKIHKKLNLHYYFVQDKAFNSEYKLINVATGVKNIGSVNVNDLKSDFDSEPKTNDYYDFLVKPMPLMYTGDVVVYDFAVVTSYGLVTDEVYRVYVDAAYGVCLGVDQIMKINNVNYFVPEYRVFFLLLNT